MNGIFYLVGLTLVGLFVLEALVHSPGPTIKKSGVPGLIQVPWRDAAPARSGAGAGRAPEAAPIGGGAPPPAITAGPHRGPPTP